MKGKIYLIILSFDLIVLTALLASLFREGPCFQIGLSFWIRLFLSMLLIWVDQWIVLPGILEIL